MNPTPHRLDKAAADRKSQPGSGALSTTAVGAVELLKDPLEVLRQNAGSFVRHLDYDPVVLTPRLNLDRRSGWGVLCRIIKQIEQDLLEKNAVDGKHWQFGGYPQT